MTHIALRNLILTLTLAVVFVGSTLAVTTIHAAGCQNMYGSNTQPPAGYGAAYNVLSTARELLVQGTDCSATSYTMKVGSGDAAQLVYNKGWWWDGTGWKSYTLTSSTALQFGTWYAGSATGNITPASGGATYVVGYVCTSAGAGWKCGCRDATCAASFWQLQYVNIVATGPVCGNATCEAGETAVSCASDCSGGGGGGTGGGSCDSGPASHTPMNPGTPRVYPATTGNGTTPFFPDYTVSVGGRSSPVYQAYVHYPEGASSNIGFTNFDVNGSINVTVTVNKAVSSAKVLPTSYGVRPSVNGNTVTIPIPHPGTYELQINDSMSRSLMIFANPHEVNPPTQSGSGVVYYGPGVHNVGTVNMQSNTTYYLAPGAVVHGAFRGNGITNSAIKGRGIIDNTNAFVCESISIKGATGLKIEGVTIIDHPGTACWMMPVYNSRDTVIDGVKVISDRQNSDGMDVTSMTNLEIKNVFIRSKDDGITIKEMGGGNSSNICVHDSVIAQDWGLGALMVGEESVADEKSNIKFNNIDIIHSRAETPMAVWIFGHAHAHDIYFRNITVEQSRGFREVSLQTNAGGTYGTAVDPKGAGRISNVFFENINILDNFKPSDKSGNVSSYFFNGYKHNGQVVANPL